MKAPFRHAPLVFLAVLLVSCAAAVPLPADTSKPIEPGDRIGDLLITKGAEGEDVVHLWDLDCPKQAGAGERYSCKTDVGAKVNVSAGIYDETFTGKLDSIWADHTYEMSIEGRPVNLKAFGSIDFPHPQVLKMRAWNVVIIAEKPGEIAIHSKGVVHGDPFEDTTTYTFSAP
jgi:hypothetical protein